jgi:DNA repair exonuclease SbcCD ATPase subunit
MPDESYVAHRADEEPCSSQRHVDGRLSFCNRVKGHTGDHWTHWAVKPFTWPNVREESSIKTARAAENIEVPAPSRTDASSFAGVAREVSRLREELTRVRAANQELRQAVLNQCGDNLCWVTNLDEAKALPEAEFLESCRRYWNQIASERGEATGLKTIAQLEAEVRALAEARDQLAHEVEMLRDHNAAMYRQLQGECPICVEHNLLPSKPYACYAHSLAYDSEVVQSRDAEIEQLETALKDAQRELAELRAFVVAVQKESADDEKPVIAFYDDPLAFARDMAARIIVDRDQQKHALRQATSELGDAQRQISALREVAGEAFVILEGLWLAVEWELALEWELAPPIKKKIADVAAALSDILTKVGGESNP